MIFRLNVNHNCMLCCKRPVGGSVQLGEICCVYVFVIKPAGTVESY